MARDTVYPKPLAGPDFWAILHYILYPNKMTPLNKIDVLKDVIKIVCWNSACDQR